MVSKSALQIQKAKTKKNSDRPLNHGGENVNILDKTKKIAKIISDKKGDDIVLLDVDGLTIIADNFVVASASNENHVKTLADEVLNRLAEDGDRPLRVEGVQEGRWVVIDYGDVLVHIFHTKERDFYQLERLWKVDGNYVNYSEEEEKANEG